MKKETIKRILAWLGIGLLLAMYVSTLVFALIGTDYARQMLAASFVATLVVPVLLYVLIRAPFLSSKDPWVGISQEEMKDTNHKTGKEDGNSNSHSETKAD